jgi:hypothetical protein
VNHAESPAPVPTFQPLQLVPLHAREKSHD